MEEIINEKVRSETYILPSFVQVVGLGKRYSMAMKSWAAAFIITIDGARYGRFGGNLPPKTFASEMLALASDFLSTCSPCENTAISTKRISFS